MPALRALALACLAAVGTATDPAAPPSARSSASGSASGSASATTPLGPQPWLTMVQGSYNPTCDFNTTMQMLIEDPAASMGWSLGTKQAVVDCFQLVHNLQ
eukprot:COSAG01_NODE_38482_length_489_cov_0.646154_1_plen_100_part_10